MGCVWLICEFVCFHKIPQGERDPRCDQFVCCTLVYPWKYVIWRAANIFQSFPFLHHYSLSACRGKREKAKKKSCSIFRKTFSGVQKSTTGTFPSVFSDQFMSLISQFRSQQVGQRMDLKAGAQHPHGNTSSEHLSFCLSRRPDQCCFSEWHFSHIVVEDNQGYCESVCVSQRCWAPCTALSLRATVARLGK